MSETLIVLTAGEEAELLTCEEIIQRNLEAFYEAGTALATIRDKRLYRSTHASFENYCREKWGMTRRHANRLVGAAEVVANLGPIGPTPATESQTRELAHLDPDRQREAWQVALETAPGGKVTAAHVKAVVDGLSPADAKVVRALSQEIRGREASLRREGRLDRLAQLSREACALDSSRWRYPVIFADPPWTYEFCEDSKDEIDQHYPTMPLSEICALPVGEVALDDCILFLWATSPKLEEAFAVVKAWGFDYRTCAVWDKQWIGPGYYFRQRHELLLVAVRGSVPVPAPASRPDSIFSERRTLEHSRKPQVAYELIEGMYPDLPKLELFARETRPGWAVWGNETDRFEGAA